MIIKWVSSGAPDSSSLRRQCNRRTTSFSIIKGSIQKLPLLQLIVYLLPSCVESIFQSNTLAMLQADPFTPLSFIFICDSNIFELFSQPLINCFAYKILAYKRITCPSSFTISVSILFKACWDKHALMPSLRLKCFSTFLVIYNGQL